MRDKTHFIRTSTRLLSVPFVPEIHLHLADEATELWQKTEDALGEIGLPPPFWAFAWAGGQALARYILDRPALVRGRTVLDIASGSGLVALAAAKGGARRAIANDIDPFAAVAAALNADANGCALEVLAGDITGQDHGWDVVLTGDVFYQRDMAERMAGWLDTLAGRGALVLIGDPGRSYLPRERLTPVATYDVPVPRTLEDADVKRSSVWQFATPRRPQGSESGLTGL